MNNRSAQKEIIITETTTAGNTVTKVFKSPQPTPFFIIFECSRGDETGFIRRASWRFELPFCHQGACSLREKKAVQKKIITRGNKVLPSHLKWKNLFKKHNSNQDAGWLTFPSSDFSFVWVFRVATAHFDSVSHS